MTRAKDHLHLITPQRFFTHQQSSYGDRHVYASRTRFIPASILKEFELCAWPLAAPAETGAAMAGGLRAPVDIGARMRGMWK
jgi:DNA helicase-2/ATP-dependent DNA helicase PcrA